MNSSSYICPDCGVMLSPADDPHRCLKKGDLKLEPGEVVKVTRTGTTIEDNLAKRAPKINGSVAELRDEIIECACRLRLNDSWINDGLFQAVDAYHVALRLAAREGK